MLQLLITFVSITSKNHCFTQKLSKLMFDIVPIEAIWIVIVSAVIFAVIMYNVVHSPSADKKFNYVVLRGKAGEVFWTVDIGQYEGYEVLYQGTMEDCKKEWEKHCCGGKFNI